MSDAGPPAPRIAEEIPDALDGERVDRVVAIVASCSRSDAAALVAAGQVHLDGRTVLKPSTKVARGEQLELMALPEVPDTTVVADPSIELDVVHEDDQVLVVDKPPGLVVHPGPGHAGSTLVHGLLALHPELAEVGEASRPGLVHRLDRGTSGLLVVARTPEAYEHLVAQLSDHSVTREYTALVWGRPEHAQGVIDAPIGRSRRDPLRMTVAVDGRPARTHYRSERTYHEPVQVSLLTCRLETGRTHQIRVHLASVGHAVVGDDVYGGTRHSFEAPRPFLHARHLEFVHPGTGQLVGFDSPLPDDLVGVLDRLG